MDKKSDQVALLHNKEKKSRFKKLFPKNKKSFSYMFHMKHININIILNVYPICLFTKQFTFNTYVSNN